MPRACVVCEPTEKVRANNDEHTTEECKLEIGGGGGVAT